MARYDLNYESVTVGSAPALTTVTPAIYKLDGSIVGSSDLAVDGTKSLLFSPVSGSVNMMTYGNSSNYALNSMSLAIRAHFYFNSALSSDTTLLQIYSKDSAVAASLALTTIGNIVIRDNVTNPLVTSSAAMNTYWGKWIGLELWLEGVGTGLQLRGALYSPTSLTPVATATSTAAQTTAGANSLASIRVGKANYGNLAAQFYADRLTLETEATGLLGPYTRMLPTPVITLGASTRPTTAGGSNGTQVVTWASIPGAAGYDAYWAEGNTPSQGSFIKVGNNVSSPYTFTGLSAGVQSVGIKAKV